MGRRRSYSAPPQPFDAAHPLINKLENHVITRMVVPEFTVQEALLALYLPDTVAKLQAAWPLVRGIDRGSAISEGIVVPTVGATAVTATVTIRAHGVKSLVPEVGQVRMDRVLACQPMITAIQEAHEQHLQFEKVRSVVRWLNEYATPGAARHYCPWLTSILPADHPFQQLDGRVYREPSVGIAGIMPTMRECGAIMAAALLAGDPDSSSSKSEFKVSFTGQRGTENYTSQKFGLI